MEPVKKNCASCARETQSGTEEPCYTCCRDLFETYPSWTPKAFKSAVVAASALDVQVGGAHYASAAIQPVKYIRANNLDFFEGNVVKYVTRWKTKNGVEDLKKARHYLDMLIEFMEQDNG